MPDPVEADEFSEKLMETLANYDPNREFLAVRKHGLNVSLELYSVRDAL
jgi:hypothetical protein